MFLLRSKIYLLLLTSAFLISGCGVWENFKTYFNLYYNTTDLFEQAEQQIKESQTGLFSSEELKLPGSVNTQLTKVIEKCSEILQFHSQSSYVDEALLIIGKSFYYQKNYLKALRKFEELLATQTESDLILETNLWIGKTQIKLKNYESALTILEQAREQAIAEQREDIIKEAFVEEIIYQLTRENYPLAISLANQFLEVLNDEDIKTEVLYEIGKLYLEVEDPQNAIAAFEKVLDYKPLYQIELNTKLELGKALRSVGRKEDALNIFNDMKEEAKFSEAYNLVDLQIGITLHELGRLEDAVEKLVMVDTLYKNTPSSGIAKYELAKIYENDYQNFDSAKAYYEKSLTSSLPVEFTEGVGQKVRTFKKYQALSLQIENSRSQLFYIENPEEYTKDSITFVQDSITYVHDSLEVLAELTIYSEHLQSLAGFELDTITVRDTVAVDSLKDSTLVLDSAKVDSIKQRERELSIKNEIARQGINIDSLFAEKWDDERKFPKRPVKSDLGEDSLKSILVKNELDLGNLFLTEIEKPDSAYYYYQDILINYPNTYYHANTLYALGSYYLNIDRKDKADSLFNIVYENYKTESIVNAAANRLNKPLINFDFDPAKNIYAEAESELLNENYSASVDKFYQIYREFSTSTVAPKALFASGWILENKLDLNDSAAVVYDTLASHYPQSEYTIKVKPKLTAYKQFQADLKKAVEDSLKRIEEEKINLASKDSSDVYADSILTERTQPEQENINPNSDFEEIRNVKTPEVNIAQDSTRSAILNNQRRNPRKK